MDLLTTEALPGITVHVFGPSRDKDAIRDMEPPPGKSYLQLLESLEAGTGSAPDPFNEDWWLSPQEDSRLDEDECRAIANAGGNLDPAIMVALEKAVNGTSLMLLFKIGSSYLLFPGDAQWGTWRTALANPEWRLLLQRASFYKAGHHGSHNGTPVEFVENMQKETCVMISTKHIKRWPHIPKLELLEALGKHTTKIARSDQETPSQIFNVEPGVYTEACIPI